MTIPSLVDKYISQKAGFFYGLPCKKSTVESLIELLKKQVDILNTDNLDSAIVDAVRSYTRNKDVAIRVYKHFIQFLRENGVDIEIDFPSIDISNDFERLMFISKYLQNPDNKIDDLEEELWVSKTTIEADLKKLRGLDETGSVKICGKVFKVEDLERRKNKVSFPSTPHPLFLTPNITQVIVSLKGLKKMSEDPLYERYAYYLAADIWEQLSDYAKDRIRVVLTELLPEDFAWYESLSKNENDEDDYEEEYFYSERRCSANNNVILDCLKNGKMFFAEYVSDGELFFYKNCYCVPGTYNGDSIEVDCDCGRVALQINKIIKSAYSIEELI